ncbi:GNAT family protein [Flavitalea sp. BT771]|uniref:GNAT family N-acetyltransferase n=1 Tax=Flavitalea sp. BT771 TaxID=3063329 RepID=UPI0026E3AA2E|nr:GNAT family protein [Flavitalea sp. BT771]MDO6430595.1 GNAT family protein [Flavitalea sp. BT771]MDV6219265.1 GNAT family protein [Flavitalea sp. BT771]
MDLAKTYRIETERLVLRCYEPGDASRLHEAIIRSLDHLRPWLPWVQHEPKDPEARIDLIRMFRGQFDLGMDYAFGIFDKMETTLIGSTGLHTRIGKNAREIGYWIGVDHVGKGYATEAVSALVRIAFGIEGLSRIEIRCAPDNIRSRHVPEKLGFQMEGVIKRTLSDDIVDTMVWAMTKKDYESNPIRQLRIKTFDLAGRALFLP